jgi:hypothetical protein
VDDRLRLIEVPFDRLAEAVSVRKVPSDVQILVGVRRKRKGVMQRRDADAEAEGREQQRDDERRAAQWREGA